LPAAQNLPVTAFVYNLEEREFIAVSDTGNSTAITIPTPRRLLLGSRNNKKYKGASSTAGDSQLSGAGSWDVFDVKNFTFTQEELYPLSFIRTPSFTANGRYTWYVTGGYDNDTDNVTDAVQIWNSISDTWIVSNFTLNVPRYLHSCLWAEETV
jgi:hypothetical protein